MLKLAFSALTLSFLVPSAHAGTEIRSPGKEIVLSSPFDKGGHELQFGIGYNFTSASDGPLRPSVEDLDASLRFGWMLNSPGLSGILRRNSEFMIEAVAGGVTSGPSGAIAGGRLIYRANFIQPESRWIPYLQFGLGAAYTDIDRQHPQRLIGQDFEFIIEGEVGVRYLLNAHTAVYAEMGYRHISNADIADRNLGMNSVTAQGGVSWFW